MTKLTGQNLLSHHNKGVAEGVSKGQLVREAGYTVLRPNGEERLYFTEYYEEILIAKGAMIRVKVDMAELTPQGVQPIWSDNFTTNSRNKRTISRKVRAMIGWTNKRCYRTENQGKVALYRGDEMVMFNVA
jgi:hypothetical protein